jgi:hypothetical protein
MPKIYVHDFYFEYSEIENSIGEEDFCCSLNVYYNFSPQDPENGWDDLEYFNITVASPFGLAKYVNKCIKQENFPKSFFYSHILFFERNEKQEIMEFVKRELQSIQGNSERELVLKAIRKFGWESENTPEVYNRLFV